MRSTSIDTGLSSPATFFIKRPIRSLLPQMNRKPIDINADDEHYEALKTGQDKYFKGSDAHKDSLYFPIGLQ